MPFTPSRAAPSAARIEGRTQPTGEWWCSPPPQVPSRAGPSIHPDEASGHSGRTGYVQRRSVGVPRAKRRGSGRAGCVQGRSVGARLAAAASTHVPFTPSRAAASAARIEGRTQPTGEWCCRPHPSTESCRPFDTPRRSVGALRANGLCARTKRRGTKGERVVYGRSVGVPRANGLCTRTKRRGAQGERGVCKDEASAHGSLPLPRRTCRSPRVEPLLQRRVSRGARNRPANGAVGPTQVPSRAGPSIHPDEASGHSGRTGCVQGRSVGVLRASGLYPRTKRRGTKGERVVRKDEASGHSGQTGCVQDEASGLGLLPLPRRHTCRSPRVEPLLQRRVSRGARNRPENGAVGPTQVPSRAGPSIHPDEASGHSGRTGCVQGRSVGVPRASGLCARTKRRGTKGERVVYKDEASGRSGRAGCVQARSAGARLAAAASTHVPFTPSRAAASAARIEGRTQPTGEWCCRPHPSTESCRPFDTPRRSVGALRANGLCARTKRRGTKGERVVCKDEASGYQGRAGCVQGRSVGALRASGLCASTKRRRTACCRCLDARAVHPK